MHMQSHILTGHARERIAERSVSTEECIVSMLDEGLFVPIGTESGTERSHELVYLPDDRHWFVIIRDSRTLELITFLPVYYHENISWKVSFDAMQMARELVMKEEKREEEPALHITHQAEPPELKISLIYDVGFNNTKRKNLGSYPVPAGFPTEELLNDSCFAETMLQRIAEKGIPLESAACIAIKKRKNDDDELLIAIDLHTGTLEPLSSAREAS